MNWTFTSHANAEVGRAAFGKRPAVWGSYWVEVEARALTIGHDDSDTVRLELEDLALVGAVEAREGALRIANPHGTMLVPLVELEAVYLEHTVGVTPPPSVEVHITTTYPLREPNERVVGKVVWLLADDALVNVGRAQLRLDHRQYGLEQGMEVAFVDALAPGTWAALDVPGRPRQILIEPLAPYTVIARVVRRKPRAVVAGSGPVARSDELARLIREIAEYDSDHDRGVLIDLLADRGEACAAVFAQLRAGAPLTPAKRRVALGPLDAFLRPVEFRHGLPHSGVLRKDADRDRLPALLADARLGLLAALRLGKAGVELYTRIIANGQLLSLREAEAPSFTVLRALKDAGHTQLTHLYDVRFSEPAAVALLGDPAFASVRELELRIEQRFADQLLRRLIADDHGVFARAPRHLTFVERNQSPLALSQIVFARFPELTNASVTIGGVTVANVDGQPRATIAVDAIPGVVAAMRDMLPGIA
ncbi:MAG: hypothetical protein ABI591_06835 [Kofleriaceae bacterium]